MSLDYPNRNDWLAKRYTSRPQRSERLFWARGTYVRKRADPKENARLTQFAKVCNGNLAAKQR